MEGLYCFQSVVSEGGESTLAPPGKHGWELVERWISEDLTRLSILWEYVPARDPEKSPFNGDEP